MIKRAFTEHPASVGESYFQRNCIEDLHDRMVAHRDRRGSDVALSAMSRTGMQRDSDMLRAAE